MGNGPHRDREYRLRRHPPTMGQHPRRTHTLARHGATATHPIRNRGQPLNTIRLPRPRPQLDPLAPAIALTNPPTLGPCGMRITTRMARREPWRCPTPSRPKVGVARPSSHMGGSRSAVRSAAKTSTSRHSRSASASGGCTHVTAPRAVLVGGSGKVPLARWTPGGHGSATP